jgi:hypothetical protein
MGRRIKNFLCRLSLLLAVPVLGPAQGDPVLPNLDLPPRLSLVGPPLLPAGAEWVLLVHQSGGFSGVSETITIDSIGGLRCSGFEVACAAQIQPDALAILHDQIMAMTGEEWSGVLAPCSDCLTRLVILVSEGPQEDPVERVAYWNLAVPESALDAGRLHQTVRDAFFPN